MSAWAVQRYSAALSAHWLWILVGVALAIIAQNPFVRRSAGRLPYVGIAVTAVVCTIAMWLAWRMLWIGDDAFISMHYARNWIEGHGLVFNIGERVEGFTNFLWLAILAALGRLGADMPTASVVLGIASHVAAIIATRWVVRLVLPDDDVRVSLASIAVALSYPMLSFATGGLETMFCAALVIAACGAAHAGRPFVAGALAILATMGHPDHALFYVAIGAVLLARRHRELRHGEGRLWSRPAARDLVRYALPFIAIYVPYFVARWAYYGDPFPNTYYAKSGSGTYFGQGVVYLFASALVAGLPFVVPAVARGAYAARNTVFGQIALVSVPAYLLYVAKIGGDYMAGRLLVAVLPLLFVLAEVGVRTVRRLPVRTLLAATFVFACLPTPLHKPSEVAFYMTDERTLWTIDTLRPLHIRGGTPARVARLQEYVGPVQDSGYRVTYAAWAIGYVAWLTRFRIVDMHGLIDPVLARQPIAQRGRPGHEHQATPAHVLERGADLSGMKLYPEPYGSLTVVNLKGELFHLSKYRRELVDKLVGAPGASVVDFPSYFDRWAQSAASLPHARLEADAAFFEQYYFSVNEDPARRAQLHSLRTAPGGGTPQHRNGARGSRQRRPLAKADPRSICRALGRRLARPVGNEGLALAGIPP